MSSVVSKSENLNSLCVVDSKIKTLSTISSTVPKHEIIPGTYFFFNHKIKYKKIALFKAFKL